MVLGACGWFWVDSGHCIVLVITQAERQETNIAEHLFKFQCPTWEILNYWGLTILFYFINTLLRRSKVTTDSRELSVRAKLKIITHPFLLKVHYYVLGDSPFP